MSEKFAECDDCGRPYDEEHGFADMILPQDMWNAISPRGDEGGLLCPCCIIARLAKAGLRSRVALFSRVTESVSEDTMTCIRRLDNIEAALEGRRNRWGAALDERIAEGVKAIDAHNEAAR